MIIKQFKYLGLGDIIIVNGLQSAVTSKPVIHGVDKTYQLTVISEDELLHEVYDKGRVKYNVIANLEHLV